MVAALLLAGCRGDVEPPPETSPVGVEASVAAGEAARFPASDVLRGWDLARSQAFGEGDVAALRRLYVEGSAAGTSDARLLQAYLRRGLRVEGMRMQLLALEVLRQEPRRLLLLVTDRLVGAVAVGQGTRTPLPQDQASTRVVDLRREDGTWRVASVRSAPRQAAR